MNSSSAFDYSLSQRWLHWGAALLVGLALYTGFYHGGAFPGTGISRFLTHTSAGFILLPLMLWRLAIRRRPAAPTATLADRAARAMHGLLYLLLIAQPLSAIVARLCNGGQLKLLGGIVIDPFLPKGTLPKGWLMEFHELTGTLLLWLILAHILAALYHAVILRDGLLRRMIP